MEYLFSAWAEIKDRIGKKTLQLFLDFDGTLAPIASSPAKAQLLPETLDLLKNLAEKNPGRIAIISGRQLADLKRKINIGSLVYVGNHGLEIEGPGIRHIVTLSDAYPKTLQSVKLELQKMIGGYKGILIEDKSLSLSVHFRLVKLEEIRELQNKIRAILLPYLRKALIKVRSGKMVFEVRPPIAWDKGKAVLWLIDKWRDMHEDDLAVSLYCGDDATDEDAFRVLEKKGLTIVVGAHDDSAAQYYLNSQKEMDLLLNKISELKK